MGESGLRVVRGGALAPEQVFGRQKELAELVRMLETDSVLLLAERRTGKTSLLTLFAANAPVGWAVVKTSVESIASPDEFVRRLVEATRHLLPIKTMDGINAVLDRMRITSLGPIARGDEQPTTWRESFDTWRRSMATLEQHVVLVLDELPYAIQNIATRVSAESARDVLDVLRETRQNFPIRFVLCGSIGLHHVIGDIRNAAWSPINDITQLDLGPLGDDDATQLADALLRGEAIDCDDRARVARTIANETSGVPFYVHSVVGLLLDQQKRPVTEADAIRTVKSLLDDPQDRLDLRHFEKRLKDYYANRESLAKAVLDAIATEKEIAFPRLVTALSATNNSTSDDVREMLEDLQRDHYIVRMSGKFRFRLEIIRRAWVSMRYLGE